MSVHQESLDMAKPMERAQDPPELEYNTYRHDSLSMFGAAIGGAVLGMLLTLLILAIINGGTLSFSGGERLALMEASMARIDENVGAVAHNVEVVAQQAKDLQAQLLGVESSLHQAIDTNSADVAVLQNSVSALEGANSQFVAFLVALNEALDNVSELTAAASASGE